MLVPSADPHDVTTDPVQIVPPTQAPDTDLLGVSPGETQDICRRPRFWELFNPSDGPWRYIRRAAVMSLVPSMFIAIMLHATGLMGDTPTSDKLSRINKGVMILLVLVFAPLVETLIMAGILRLLRRTRKSLPVLAGFSAVIWGLFHIGNGLMIPLVIAWPFYVFSAAYLTWRPQGWAKAIAIAATIHLIQNTLPALAFLAM